MAKRAFTASGTGAALTSMLAGFDTLSLFNAITPKERNVRRIARDIAYGDDPRQRYDVYAPRTAAAPLPVLVFFYGGNWAEGSKDVYSWMGHALASLGFVVTLPDYRLVPEVHFPDFVADGATAVRHVLAHAADYGADRERLAVMGHSAGAYNAVMLALDPQFLPDVRIDACIGVAGPYDFYPFDVPASRNAFGAWPRAEETQPVRFARSLDTRFLLMQSRGDTVVGTHNAVNLAAGLSAADTEVELRLYDGPSHQDMAAAFSIPFRRKAPLLSDAAAFLRRSG